MGVLPLPVQARKPPQQQVLPGPPGHDRDQLSAAIPPVACVAWPATRLSETGEALPEP